MSGAHQNPNHDSNLDHLEPPLDQEQSLQSLDPGPPIDPTTVDVPNPAGSKDPPPGPGNNDGPDGPLHDMNLTDDDGNHSANSPGRGSRGSSRPPTPYLSQSAAPSARGPRPSSGRYDHKPDPEIIEQQVFEQNNIVKYEGVNQNNTNTIHYDHGGFQDDGREGGSNTDGAEPTLKPNQQELLKQCFQNMIGPLDPVAGPPSSLALPFSTLTSGRKKVFEKTTLQAHVCCLSAESQVPPLISMLHQDVKFQAVRNWMYAYRLRVGEEMVVGYADGDLLSDSNLGLENMLLIVSRWDSGVPGRLGGRLFSYNSALCKELLRQVQQVVLAEQQRLDTDAAATLAAEEKARMGTENGFPEGALQGELGQLEALENGAGVSGSVGAGSIGAVGISAIHGTGGSHGQSQGQRSIQSRGGERDGQSQGRSRRRRGSKDGQSQGTAGVLIDDEIFDGSVNDLGNSLEYGALVAGRSKDSGNRTPNRSKSLERNGGTDDSEDDNGPHHVRQGFTPGLKSRPGGAHINTKAMTYKTRHSFVRPTIDNPLCDPVLRPAVFRKSIAFKDEDPEHVFLRKEQRQGVIGPSGREAMRARKAREGRERSGSFDEGRSRSFEEGGEMRGSNSKGGNSRGKSHVHVNMKNGEGGGGSSGVGNTNSSSGGGFFLTQAPDEHHTSTHVPSKTRGSSRQRSTSPGVMYGVSSGGVPRAPGTVPGTLHDPRSGVKEHHQQRRNSNGKPNTPGSNPRRKKSARVVYPGLLPDSFLRQPNSARRHLANSAWQRKKAAHDAQLNNNNSPVNLNQWSRVPISRARTTPGGPGIQGLGSLGPLGPLGSGLLPFSERGDVNQLNHQNQHLYQNQHPGLGPIGGTGRFSPQSGVIIPGSSHLPHGHGSNRMGGGGFGQHPDDDDENEDILGIYEDDGQDGYDDTDAEGRFLLDPPFGPPRTPTPASSACAVPLGTGNGKRVGGVVVAGGQGGHTSNTTQQQQQQMNNAQAPHNVHRSHQQQHAPAEHHHPTPAAISLRLAALCSRQEEAALSRERAKSDMMTQFERF